MQSVSFVIPISAPETTIPPGIPPLYREHNGQIYFDTNLLTHIVKRMDPRGLEILKSLSPLGRYVESSGRTFLHYAAEAGNAEVAEYLARSAGEIDAQDCHGKTALMLAAGHPDTIRVLLKANANIHVRDETGKCAVQLVIENTPGEIEILEKLRDEYANDVARIADRLASFKCPIYPVLALKNARLTRLLLERGSRLMPSGYLMRDGTALLHAIRLNYPENVRVLLDYGVSVNEKHPRDSHTPMMWYGTMCQNERISPEILRLLLRRGADPNEIVVHRASRLIPQSSEILTHCDRATIRVLLLESDVDLDSRDDRGYTALHRMASNRWPGVFRELEGRRCDANARDNEGKTPLHRVSVVDPLNLSAVEGLLMLGADVNAKDPNGMTPLMNVWQYSSMYLTMTLALLGGSSTYTRESCKRVVECLLCHGADAASQRYSIVSSGKSENEVYLMQSVLAQLALAEARGVPIGEAIGNEIRRDARLSAALDECKGQIEEMKQVKVWRSITLYELLIASEVKIERYARKQTFLLNLRRIQNNNKYIPYYIYVLRGRVAKAVKIVTLRKEVAAILCEAVGWCQNSHSTIIDKITSYLSERDLRKLHCKK